MSRGTHAWNLARVVQMRLQLHQNLLFLLLLSLPFRGAMSDLSWHLFDQIVLKAFDQAAVRTDSSETKVLPSSAVEEFHKILEHPSCIWR